MNSQPTSITHNIVETCEIVTFLFTVEEQIFNLIEGPHF